MGTRNFPDYRQHQFVVLVCPRPLQSDLPSHSTIFPSFCTLPMFPGISRALRTYLSWSSVLPLSLSAAAPALQRYCASTHLSSFLLYPLFYATFLLELIWRTDACCGCFHLSHTYALLCFFGFCIWSSEDWQHLLQQYTTSIQSLEVWPFYLLSPDGSSLHSYNLEVGSRHCDSVFSECPNKSHSPQKYIMHQSEDCPGLGWHLCVL